MRLLLEGNFFVFFNGHAHYDVMDDTSINFLKIFFKVTFFSYKLKKFEAYNKKFELFLVEPKKQKEKYNI